MVKNLFLSIALAAGLIFVAASDRAEAAMVSPAVTAPDTAQSGLVEDVRWRCGPGACWWTPGYTGYVPPLRVRLGVSPIAVTVTGGSAVVAHGGTTASRTTLNQRALRGPLTFPGGAHSLRRPRRSDASA